MFATSFSKADGFDKYVLEDTDTQTFVEILPACGAILHSFNVLHGNAFVNIIDSYASSSDFTTQVATAGFKGCKLSPFACRVENASYEFAQTRYTLEKFKLKEHAIHGLLYDAVFTELHQYTDSASAGISMKHAYRGEDKGYPFKYDCIVAYHLRKNNQLTVITEIINQDEGLLPIQDGWHPYFSFGGPIDDLMLEFQSTHEVVMDDRLIPTGEKVPYHEFDALRKIGPLQLDHCFALNFAECQPLCVLRDSKLGLQLEIHPDHNYPYLQVYTPPHRKSIALENLSAIPDAFNNKTGLITLQPGENIIFTTTFKITGINTKE